MEVPEDGFEGPVVEKRKLGVWNVADGSRNLLLDVSGPFYEFDVSESGRMAALWREGGNIEIWETGAGHFTTALKAALSPGGGGDVRRILRFSPDEKTVVCFDGRLAFLDVSSGRRTRSFEWSPHPGSTRVNSIEFSAEGRLCVAAGSYFNPEAANSGITSRAPRDR